MDGMLKLVLSESDAPIMYHLDFASKPPKCTQKHKWVMFKWSKYVICEFINWITRISHLKIRELGEIGITCLAHNYLNSIFKKNKYLSFLLAHLWKRFILYLGEVNALAYMLNSWIDLHILIWCFHVWSLNCSGYLEKTK